jgi:hypothetical protein
LQNVCNNIKPITPTTSIPNIQRSYTKWTTACQPKCRSYFTATASHPSPETQPRSSSPCS